MQRFYGIDLRGAQMGARRLLALLRGLPDDAACKRDVWTLRDEVAAKTLEAVDHWGRVHAMLFGDKRAQDRQPPVMVAAPSRATATQPRKEPITDPRAIAAWLGTNMGGKRA